MSEFLTLSGVPAVVPAGENPVVILNACASAVDAVLLSHHADAIAAGLAAFEAERVVCVPEEAPALEQALNAAGIDATWKVIPASPVLRQETALYTAIDTGVIRVHPMIKTFAAEGWQHRPTLVLDAETAYHIGSGKTDTKWIVVNGEPQEVALGTSLSALLGETKKPALLGGGVGRFVAPDELAGDSVAYKWIYDSLQSFGEKDCLADAAAKAIHRDAEQSCHNCVLCREGSWHLDGYFTAITAGKGKKDDLAMIEDIAPIMAAGCLCDFGKGMALCALSAVKAGRSELEAHIVKKKCPAGVCKAFANYAIKPDLCTGCGDCIDECPEDAIEGKKGFIHMIDPDMCEKCGKCAEVCEENAIVCGEDVRVPKKLTRVGRFK